jgi:hypothetical protein
MTVAGFGGRALPRSTMLAADPLINLSAEAGPPPAGRVVRWAVIKSAPSRRPGEPHPLPEFLSDRLEPESRS